MRRHVPDQERPRAVTLMRLDEGIVGKTFEETPFQPSGQLRLPLARTKRSPGEGRDDWPYSGPSRCDAPDHVTSGRRLLPGLVSNLRRRWRFVFAIAP